MMRIERNKKLAQFTTFGVGGSAEYFCNANNPKEFFECVEWADKKKVSWKLFAGGSNLVLPDTKVKGLVIRMIGGRIQKKGNLFIVDAGVPLARVITTAIRAGLAGLEQLSGIPGTLGGAIVGNAGAYGRSISEVITRVLVWDGREISWIGEGECGFDYRESILKHNGWVVLRAELKFIKGNKDELRAHSREIITERLKKYPKGLKCPGSYFKNIIVGELLQKALSKIDFTKIIAGKIPAGYLLEAVGAKGMKKGDVRVAEYHGNLILNEGKGSMRDAKALARILKAKVKKRFGITLEEEVRYWQ